jgi:hypothetical protein
MLTAIQLEFYYVIMPSVVLVSVIMLSVVASLENPIQP